MTLSIEDRAALARAKHLLEDPSFAARVTNLVGSPIEKGIARLPKSAQQLIGVATQKALMSALAGALITMDKAMDKQGAARPASPRLHKLMGAASGAAGGFFGLPALPIELPISTALMLRAIADVARAHGEDLTSAEARLACLQVFAFGGNSSADDATGSGYFAARAGLARAVGEAASYLAEKTVIDQTAPALLRLVAKIATRFAIPVSEKLAIQTLPLVGAAGGAAVNTLFIDHFQHMAEGHFTVRELERKHGEALVQREYEALPKRA